MNIREWVNDLKNVGRAVMYEKPLRNCQEANRLMVRELERLEHLARSLRQERDVLTDEQVRRENELRELKYELGVLKQVMNERMVMPGEIETPPL